MNEYDSDKIADLMQTEEDFVLVDNEKDADLLVLNTCSIREKAQEKVFHQIGRWRKIKDVKPDIKIAIGGCVASQEGENIIKRAPAVDIVFGPQTLHKLPSLYKKEDQTLSSQVDISFPKLEKFESMPSPETSEASAFVSIIEGCNKYCSFCVVPHTRGHEVSRSVEDILNEVSALADQGVREIHFLGQNVNNFKGTFRGEKSSLARLIELTGKVENIKRIRFTTSHPHEFKDDLVDVYGKVPELVSHVHLPVQSGSDRILKLMRRRYSAEKYMNLVERILDVRPDMRFSSDFIVGFPGETDHDFEQTMNLINQVKFDESFSFIYSPRPNTPAAEMQDEIDHDIKKERLIFTKSSQSASFFTVKKWSDQSRCFGNGCLKRDWSIQQNYL
ncbi:MAG: hypothetical protein CM15mP22_7130 [Gammaproteobacteria bacterium]|nr:MAG: hypothetical protein CM15mP22_7130 [Gammaproteobacteria bacterium]